MGVLLLWNVFFPPARAPQPPAESVPTAQRADSAVTTPGATDHAEIGTGPTTPAADAGSMATAALDEGLAPPEGVTLPEAVQVRVQTNALHLTIDGLGARVTEVALPRYIDQENHEVQLLPQPGPGALASIASTASGPLPLDTLPFRLVSDTDNGAERRITWELATRGLVLRKTFVIPDEGSLVRVEQELVEDRLGIRSWGLSWAGGLRVTEDLKGNTAKNYFEGAAFAEGSVQRKKAHDAHKGPILFPGQTRWVSVLNKYFLAAIVPRGEAQGPARLWEAPSGHEDSPSLAGDILVDRGSELATNQVQYDVYIGPQDYAALQSLGLGLEGALDLGSSWVRPLSRIILSTLIAVHRVIPNYGVTIILFSTLINLLFFPLTYKSTKSMRQMSALKPRLDALKEKYKEDAQKLSEATMRLYKEAGVNPLAGCLPLILQMPIFFALYAVLFRTIELRQAPFLFWIRDLSQPDVVFQLPFALPIIGSGICILPIIMGITSYFQSKQTMMDPSQQMMVVLMPIMMTVIFFSMPSGLVLYWLTTNVFTLGSKYVFKTQDDDALAGVATVTADPPRASKRTAKVGAKG